jgi:hypothetical protein
MENIDKLSHISCYYEIGSEFSYGDHIYIAIEKPPVSHPCLYCSLWDEPGCGYFYCVSMIFLRRPK